MKSALTAPLSLALALSSPNLFATKDIPVVRVEQSPLALTAMRSEHRQLRSPDIGALLASLPGTSLNSNGTLSTSVQYRGASGERINVSIDGANFGSGGPNKMDSALSYIPGALLDTVEITRGIVSVSEGQETLGGHVSASAYQAGFGDGQNWQFRGRANSLISSNGEGHSSGVNLFAVNQQHRIGLSLSYDKGNNTELGGGDELPNSQYQRARSNLHYGYQGESSGLTMMLGRNKTKPTGTAALPMDIAYINADLASLNIYRQVGEGKLTAKISYADIDHMMDNFRQRLAPNITMMMNGMAMTSPMQRQTRATGKNLAWQISYQWPVENERWEIGLDNNNSEHHANITDPSNAMFQVLNFNQSERQTLGAFIEWRTERGPWLAELGLRFNRTELDAQAVSFSGMMGMAASNASALAQAFNQADRSRQHRNTDMVAKLSYKTENHWSFHLGLANKNRAPSYQEMYLWLPLQATGGLADGRNYIGNLNLKSETAREINLSADWRNGRAYIRSQIFYRKITNYIQGTSLDDPRAAVASNLRMPSNMLATMMGGSAALQFNNVDARLYGADIAYGVALNPQWRIDAALSYVRGQREDLSDNLYRIAPLNHRLSLSYASGDYQLSAESVIFAKQDKTAAVNHEQASSGYGIINLRGQWQVEQALLLHAGLDNITDQRYQDHLAGYNRVRDAEDLAAGERLYGLGRSAYIGFSWHW